MLAISKRKLLAVLILVSIAVVLSILFLSESVSLPSPITLLPFVLTHLNSVAIVSSFYNGNRTTSLLEESLVISKQLTTNTTLVQKSKPPKHFWSSTTANRILTEKVSIQWGTEFTLPPFIIKTFQQHILH